MARSPPRLRGGAGGAVAVLLVLLAAAAAPASGGGGEVPGVGTVVVGELLGETSERYASWNVDMSFNRGFSHINFTNPNLIAAAASLRPSTLRCGGTGNDYQHYALGSHANVPCPAPANDTPALAKAKIGRIMKATQGCRACSSRSSGCSSPVAMGTNMAVTTPARVACTPDFSTQTQRKAPRRK